MNNTNLSIHNKFDIKVYDAKTKQLKRKETAYNIICDSLWNRLFKSDDTGLEIYNSYILVGDGAGVPSTSDITLFSQIGSYQTSDENNRFDITSPTKEKPRTTFDNTTGIATIITSIVIGSTELVGYEIKELGIGYNNTNCVTHSVLKDLNNNQISILKTDQDIIQIMATIYLHFERYTTNIQFLSNTDSIIWTFLGIKSYGTGYQLVVKDICYYDANVTTYPNSFKTNNITISDYHPTFDHSNHTVTLSGRLDGPISNINLNTIFVKPVKGIRSFTLGGYSSGLLNSFSETLVRFTDASWFDPPMILNEAIGTGDGVKTDFSSTFPYRSNGSIYVNGALSDGYFSDEEPICFFSPMSSISPSKQYTNQSQALSITYTYYADLATSDMYKKSYLLYEGLDSSSYIATRTSSPSQYYYIQCIYMPYDANLTSSEFKTRDNQKIKKIYMLAEYVNGYDIWNSLNDDSNVYIQIEGSDDNINWSIESTFLAGRPQQNGTRLLRQVILNTPRRYFRFRHVSGTYGTANYLRIGIINIMKESGGIGNIQFPTPPPAGAIITADYKPNCIAKDENHVFDCAITITVNDYQGNS